MPQILVRVKKGHRLCEAGVSYGEMQTFWVDPERLRDLSDSVEKIEGIKVPEVRTTAMDSPSRAPVPEPGRMPEPDIRLIEPRQPEPVVPKPAEPKPEPVVENEFEEERKPMKKKPSKPMGGKKKPSY
jgi:outer membrane biosynthesis protein TonB